MSMYSNETAALSYKLVCRGARDLKTLKTLQVVTFKNLQVAAGWANNVSLEKLRTKPILLKINACTK